MTSIGIHAFWNDNPNEPVAPIQQTVIRPLVGESIMILGQRFRIVDIATNTGTYIRDLLYLFVEEL